jgi:hypothetical protein
MQPRPAVELGPMWRQGKVERGELTGEVGVKLAGRDLERFRIAATWVGLTQLVVAGKVALRVQVEAHDRVLVGDQGQGSHRAVDHRVGPRIRLPARRARG